MSETLPTGARSGMAFAVVSAMLFGLTPVLAKPLLDGLNPFLVSGLMYLGAGLLMGLHKLAGGIARRRDEPRLNRMDLPWLALAIFCGGIAGPVLLMFGLSRIGAAETSLLLNLEGLATMLIAWLVFRENVDGRLFIGAMAILLGAGILSWQGGGALNPAALLVAAACLMWGVDNNVTRKISAADPVEITLIKGLVAGGVNCAIGLALPGQLPSLPIVAGIGAIGAMGIGVSLVLFIRALRHLGTARTGAYFSTAPFIGATAAVLFSGEPMTIELVAAGMLMVFGLWLHLVESHDHTHEHAATEHEHLHAHDAHHQHEHAPGEAPASEPHSHKHAHGALRHAHPHYPDIHHRHVH